MDFTLWSFFALSYLGITLSPGPNVLNVISNASNYGLKSIYVTIAGNLLCQLFIIIAVGLGVGLLLSKHSDVYAAMKFLGAFYLIYLGVKGLYSSWRGTTKKMTLSTPQNLHSIPPIFKRFTSSFFVSASNPKTVIFLSAFLPQFLRSETSVFMQFTVMYITIALTVLFVHTVYAIVFLSAQRNKFFSFDSRFFPNLSAVIFILLGLNLWFSTN